MLVKDTKFETSWLMEPFGWVTLRVVPDYANPGMFLIRTHLISGHYDGSFVWAECQSEKEARLHVASLDAEQVHDHLTAHFFQEDTQCLKSA